MWFIIIFKFPKEHTIFHILRWTKLETVWNTESHFFIQAWSPIFSSETVVVQINQPFMF